MSLIVAAGLNSLVANLDIEPITIHPRTWGIETINTNKMKNMNTTLEIPEGSKATIAGKVIDGKNYLVVEVEQESEGENIFEIARKMLDKKRAEIEAEAPEWAKFKRGDVLICPDAEKEIFVIFGEYVEGSNHTCFNCIFNSTGDTNTNWVSSPFRKTTKEEEGRFFKWLREEKGLEWDGEKLVNVLKEGDLAIFWDDNSEEARIAIYKRFDNDNGLYVDHSDIYWFNALKWDGTKEQYEKVLRGELK